MRPSGSGAGNCGNRMRISSGAVVLGQGTRGIWMNSIVTMNGRTAPSLACRRPGREHSRYPGAASSQQESSRGVLPEAAEGIDVHCHGDHHRPAENYGAAKQEILPGVEHRQHRYLNNRTENSHQPARQRERRMQGFKSPGHAQRFLSAYSLISQHFPPSTAPLLPPSDREEIGRRFQSWQEMTSLTAVVRSHVQGGVVHGGGYCSLSPLDTRLGQYPPHYKRSDDSLGRHGLGGWAYCPRRSARASLA